MDGERVEQANELERARMLKRMNAHRIKEPLLPLLVLFSSNIAGE